MGTVANVFKNGQLSEIEQPENLQLYNIWNVSGLNEKWQKGHSMYAQIAHTESTC